MADRKIIKLDMKIDPVSEISQKPVRSWIALSDKLKGEIKGIPVKRSMDLDARKWKLPVLVKGVNAVASYELKIFATKAVKIHQDISKNKKDHSKGEDELIKAYKSISKQIEDKVSLALDEVESDKGDSKNVIKDGRTAFKKSAKPKSMDPCQDCREKLTKMFATLVLEIRKFDISRQLILSDQDYKALDAGNSSDKARKLEQDKLRADDDKGRDKALSNAANAVDSAKQKYSTARKEIEQWIEKPKKMVEGLKSKDLPPEFMTFRNAHYNDLKSGVEAVKNSLESFEEDVEKLARKLKSLQGKSGPDNRTQKDMVKIKSDFQTSRDVKNGGVSLAAFDKKFDKMSAEFKNLQNQFK